MNLERWEFKVIWVKVYGTNRKPMVNFLTDVLGAQQHTTHRFRDIWTENPVIYI